MSPEKGGAASPELIFELLNGHQRTAALCAAIALGVFDALGEGPADAATLGKRCQCSARGMRILCDYLTTVGLIAKRDGVYQHTPASAAFLDPRSPSSIASIAGFLGHPSVMEPFDKLAEAVRNGHTMMAGEGSVDPDNPVWVEFAHSMAPMMGPVAGPLGEVALEGISGPVRVLDIAAGHGLFGIAAAKLNPEAQITAVDWAKVLEVARENARKAGVEDRYHLLPGSAFDVEYGGTYDVVLLTNFLHHFDEPINVGLLKKVHKALRPGGRAAALEFVPNEDRVSPPVAAQFSLTMLAHTRGGDAYTYRELEGMYRAAGFHAMRSRGIPRSPHTVVLGEA